MSDEATPLSWEPSLDGGWILIAGTWEARVSPQDAGGWRWEVIRWGHRLAAGSAGSEAEARAKVEDRIRGVVPCAPRRRTAAREDIGPDLRSRRRSNRDRLLIVLAAGPLTTHELGELLGMSPGAVVKAASRARRAGCPIRYRATGELGCGVYEIQAEEVAAS